MAANHKDFVWLPEPTVQDDAYASLGESYSDFLSRSTLPIAKAARKFLNFNIDQIPIKYRERFYDNLRERWESAFFELIVARTMQVLGGTLTVEVPTSTGKKPDFWIQFGKETVIVEATSPEFEQKIRKEQEQHLPLLKIIEELAPKGWSIMVGRLPKIGHSDSKRDFKRILEQLFKIPPPSPGANSLRVQEKVDGGKIDLLLVPGSFGPQSIAMRPVYVAFPVDHASRIRRAMSKKRRQVRDVSYPVLIAINQSGVGKTFEDFDEALFGQEAYAKKGVFTKAGKQQPTYAGVLAYREATIFCSTDPILYIHPRFKGHLPTELLLSLEHRALDSENKIIIQPAINKSVLKDLKPVSTRLL